MQSSHQALWRMQQLSASHYEKVQVPEGSGGEGYQCYPSTLSTDPTMTELGVPERQRGKSSRGACKPLTKVLKWQHEGTRGRERGGTGQGVGKDSQMAELGSQKEELEPIIPLLSLFS